MAPKPSTVPMRVSVAISGSGTPAVMRKLRLGDVGEVRGPGVERDVEDLGAELLAVRCACQASMAGTRCSVRGET